MEGGYDVYMGDSAREGIWDLGFSNAYRNR